MADTKFSALSAGTALAGTEVIPGVQSAANVYFTPTQIKTFVHSTYGTGVVTALGVNVGSAGAPVLYNGAGGTPSAITLTNGTGLPLTTGVTGTLPVANGGTGITSFGTGVATALGVNVGSAGAFVTFNGALGTPSSGTATNLTGLPISTGVSGLGTGVATFLATPSSANLISAITDETGSGSLVFGTNPTFTNYTETNYAPSAGSSFTINLANGTVQDITTNANTTITLPSSVAGKSYTLRIHYGGAHTLTWAGGSTLKWAGGTEPTETSTNGKVDIFNFQCDGTNTYGAVFGLNF